MWGCYNVSSQLIVVSGSNDNCRFSVVNKDSKTVNSERREDQTKQGAVSPVRLPGIFCMTDM